MRWERGEIAVFGSEDEVWVGGHVHGTEVDEEVVRDDVPEEAREEERFESELPRVALLTALRTNGTQGKLVPVDSGRQVIGR